MRKIAVTISSIIIIIMTFLLCIYFSLKENVVSFSDLVKSEVSNEIINLIEKDFPSLTTNEKDLLEKKINNSKSLDNVTSKYFKAVIKDVNSTPSEYHIPDVKKDVSNLMDECFLVIQNERNVVIPSETKTSLKNIINNENLNSIYSNTITSLQSNEKVSEFINIYNFLTNKEVKNIFIFITVIFLILMLICSKPKYSYLFNLGVTFLLSGLIMIYGLVPAIDDVTHNYISSDFSKEIQTISNYLIEFSLFILIIYFVIKTLKNVKKCV
jgi:hypothetical protein